MNFLNVVNLLKVFVNPKERGLGKCFFEEMKFVLSNFLSNEDLSNVLCTLNQTTLLRVFINTYLDKKLRYRDLIYFILKLLA